MFIFAYQHYKQHDPFHSSRSLALSEIHPLRSDFMQYIGEMQSIAE